MEILILNKDYAKVTMTSVDGYKVSKTVTVKQLGNMLYRQDESVESRFMAPGLFKIYENGNRALYFYLFNARNINIRSTEFETQDLFYIPRVVMVFKFHKNEQGGGKLVNTMCYTLKDGDIFDHDTPLYHFPFNNFSRNYTPGICWGQGESAAVNFFTKEIDTFKFEALYRIFFGSVFNSHLGNYGNVSTSGVKKRVEAFNMSEHWDDRIGNYLYGFYEYLRLIAKSGGMMPYEPDQILSDPKVYNSVDSLIQASIDSI